MAKVLVTMMGRSTWGLFNSMWATIKIHRYVPSKVYLLTAGCDRNDAEVAGKMLRILLAEHDPRAEIKLEVLDENSIKDIASRVRAILAEEKRAGNELAIDVTPGKKAMVLGGMIAGWSNPQFDHAFYLNIDSLRNAGRPFMEIPLSVQRSHDIIKESAEANVQSREG